MALWHDTRTSCTLHELQQIVGRLAYTSRLVQHSRATLYPLLDGLRGRRHRPRARVQLSARAATSLRWWLDVSREFAHTPAPLLDPVPNYGQLSSDASTSTGWGWYNAAAGRFGMGTWSPRLTHLSITPLEMLASLLCLESNAHLLTGRTVWLRLDNIACVHTYTHQRPAHPLMRAALAYAHKLMIKYRFALVCTHVSTTDNHVSDDLSRAVLPPACAHATQIAAPQPYPWRCDRHLEQCCAPHVPTGLSTAT
jgi:hypothetical protein